MENVKLELSSADVQTVLNVLAEAPYKSTFQIIHKIQQQATAQAEAAAPSKKPLKKT